LNIYVASSWRNPHQQRIVTFLRSRGYEVYDFRNPALGDNGFHWSEIDPDWETWTPEQYRNALHHPIAKEGFRKDMEALKRCYCCVLVLPTGRSAHIEAGWAAGAGKPVVVYNPEHVEPELMYGMCSGGLVLSESELLDWLVAEEDRL